MNGIDRFNLRVYGIHVQEGQLLVTDEIRGHMPMTKLPGGGLEFGEGLEEGLKREWQEELQAEIEVGDIFFVNRFFLKSAFRKRDQVICFYFPVTPISPLIGTFTQQPLDFPSQENDQQVFRWVPLHSLSPDDFTFPVDKAMLPILQASHT